MTTSVAKALLSLRQRRRTVLPAVLILSFIAVIVACGPSGPELRSITGPTMGTSYHIKYISTNPRLDDRDKIHAAVDALLEQINSAMSTYREDSEVSRFSSAEPDRWFPVSNQTAEVVSLALNISEQTDGAFDVSVASLVDLWGFGPAKRGDELPSEEAIRAELDKIGYRHLEVNEQRTALRKTSPLKIDLSAIAKGYAVDRIADLFKDRGIENFLVEIGGELIASGSKLDQQPWKIAIESPLSDQRAWQKIIQLDNQAVATSGDYRNYFENDGVRYSHTIDPSTGYPIVHQLASVTVIEDTAARADALATAFMVMGPEKSLRFANVYNVPAFLIVKRNGVFEEMASEPFSLMFDADQSRAPESNLGETGAADTEIKRNRRPE